MNTNKDFKHYLRQILICAIGMFFYASGVAFTKNCNMGISPIVSVAYAMSLVIPVNMGWCTTLFNLSLFAIQRLLLKKDYPWWMMGAQLFMSIIFSIYIDATAWLWRFAVPTYYPFRLLFFLFGCFVLSMGVVIVVQANLVVLPAEGVVNAIVTKTGWKFGNVKIGVDGIMVLLTICISLGFLGKIQGIREGTLLAVLLIGSFSKISGKLFTRKIQHFINKENRTEGELIYEK